ncbi:MAG: helix-turn-helix domain-containing protein [Elusimicrobiota bacterium]|nr:MAG: helix-turn-helix domain-containing protein [Elusimicrobiota bacterium]
MTKQSNEKKTLEVLEALASPVRLQIVAILKATPVGSMGLNTIVDGLSAFRKMSKSHICEQLQILEKAGLVQKRRIGQFVWYSLQGDRLKDAGETIEALMQMVVGKDKKTK